MVKTMQTVLGPLRDGRRILLLSDTELDNDDLSTVVSLPWSMLRRYRGGLNREYADHLPTKNATLEVAYIFAEQELVSKCIWFVHQQSAFAGMLWERMCRARGGWGECLGKVSKAAMCDLCCSSYDVEKGAFNVSEQSCRGKRIPEHVCPGVLFC